MVPIQIPFDKEPHATNFGIKWTPTIITLDSDGAEHHRTVGFLAPEELIPSLLLGMGKVYFNTDKFEEAISCFEEITKDYMKSDSAPEAIYLRGICLYKKDQNPAPLKKAYEKLHEEFPESEWTKRASPYRLL